MARILILEDNYEMLDALSEALELNGHSISKGMNGRDGLDYLHKVGAFPDLIISDLRMPEVDGMAFLTAMRQGDAWSAIPVAIMSGQISDRQMVLDAGANAFIIKPFRYNELETIIDGLISPRQ